MNAKKPDPASLSQTKIASPTHRPQSTHIPVCYCLHDDDWFLECSMNSWRTAGPMFAFISRKAWNGEPGEWKRCQKVAKAAGAKVILGDWEDEDTHRRAAHDHLRSLGFDYVFTPDGDEIIEPELLQSLLTIAESKLAERVYVHMDTYWKSAEYVIRPRERLTPILLVNLAKAEHVHIRDFTGGRQLVLEPDHGVLHHLSYAGPNERIQKKIRTWGHKDEVVQGWYERVWLAWDRDHLMRNLHPTHPGAYGFAERIRVPEILTSVAPEAAPTLPAPTNWPKVSISIPLYGGEEDIAQCLDSLDQCRDLLHEVFVVDNASPDKAACVAEGYDFVTLIRNEQNLGFGKASNQGAEAATGEVVIFLNSDTVVPRAGLIRLVETLMSSGSIGAAGPLTNECGHNQQIEPTYTSFDTLDLFAEDFADRAAEDFEAPADMLVGFCLAMRTNTLEEVGGFDESFGLGTFEDNDLCYRLRRAGYRLMISSRAFVHHHGSRSLWRVTKKPWNLLGANEQKFRAKWREDVEAGFCSHLPGTKMGQVVFDQTKNPSRLRAEAQRKAQMADITLCMIVRNEERVLADCLRSALPFFKQIVVVDTGSTDRTKEIAQSFGVELYEFPWTDSFSEARNESLRHAKGKWIFWMDADDTLPFTSGCAALDHALNAPASTTAFTVAVQFIEAGLPIGTRVDHVKLFRRHAGIKFEFRLHEQNLPSIHRVGGDVIGSDIVVFHSGYDTSEEGQARKRERDWKLLSMDIQEHPRNPFVLFNIGMTYHFTGRHSEALDWLQQCIEVSYSGEAHLKKAYALLAESQNQLGNTGEALSTAMRGLQAVGNDPELRYISGKYLAAMGRFREARREYESVASANRELFSSVDIGIYDFKRLHNLGEVCYRLGDYPAARSHWKQALESVPTFLTSAVSLYEASFESGDFPTTWAMVDHIRAISGPSELWASMGCRYFDAVAGRDQGEAFLTKAVQQDPYSAGPRLVLARRLANSGRQREALDHWCWLANQDVAEAEFMLGVQCNHYGKYEAALAHMKRAAELDPTAKATAAQIKNLEAVLVEQLGGAHA